MVKTLVLPKIDCEDLLGQFLDESNYDTLIDFDCDVYRHDQLSGDTSLGEHNIILRFRKNYFTKEQQAGAYDGLMEAAKQSQNRGLAAGPKGEKLQNREWATIEQLDILNWLRTIAAYPTQEDLDFVRATAATKMDTRGLVWLRDAKQQYGFDFNIWLTGIMDSQKRNIPIAHINQSAKWVLDTFISDTTYANPVDSGIAGWFDRYPRIPYGRATSYTAHNPEKFKLAYPFLEQLNTAFASLLPQRHAAQAACIRRLDPEFYVPKTVFTTITVNKNFRTAAHRDAGDLSTGFSNLLVVAKDNDYDGGYLVLPEIRAAVNVRPGDLLLVSNHDYIHGNTPIVAKAGATLERISLVCYFREKMLELGSKAYEDLRYAFVEYRRKNVHHELYRDGWNGVSSGMFDSDEFKDFLLKHDRADLWQKHHAKVESSLESLFG
jgi:hypothetical protein